MADEPEAANATTTAIDCRPDIGDGRAVASIQCDRVLARLMRSEPRLWREQVSRTFLISDRVNPDDGLRLRVCDASSRRAEVRHGDGWVAVGGAAAAWDPVTSHGLYAAIRDGLDGAAAVSSALAGDSAAVGRFDAGRVQRYALIERRTRAAYAREARWPDAPFWASRNHGGEGHGDLRGDRRHAGGSC